MPAIPVAPPLIAVETLAEFPVLAAILASFLAVLAPILPSILTVITAILAPVLPVATAVLPVIRPIGAVLPVFPTILSAVLPVVATILTPLLTIVASILANFGASRRCGPIGAPLLAVFATLLPVFPAFLAHLRTSGSLDAGLGLRVHAWGRRGRGVSLAFGAGLSPLLARLSAVRPPVLRQNGERGGCGDNESRDRRGDHQ